MSAQDLLFIVLAIGFASLAVFGSIALWRLSRVLEVIQQAADRINKIAGIIESSVEKAATIADNVSGIARNITGLVDNLTSKKRGKDGR